MCKIHCKNMYIYAHVKFLAPLPEMWRVLGTTRVNILSVYIFVNIRKYFFFILKIDECYRDDVNIAKLKPCKDSVLFFNKFSINDFPKTQFPISSFLYGKFTGTFLSHITSYQHNFSS